MRTFEGVRSKLRHLVASPCSASFWQIWMLVFGDPEVCFVHPSGDIFLRCGPKLFYSICHIHTLTFFSHRLRRFGGNPHCPKQANLKVHTPSHIQKRISPVVSQRKHTTLQSLGKSHSLRMQQIMHRIESLFICTAQSSYKKGTGSVPSAQKKHHLPICSRGIPDCRTA
jgi:hypothetical protein